jgi:DNA replication protein DnaC
MGLCPKCTTEGRERKFRRLCPVAYQALVVERLPEAARVAREEIRKIFNAHALGKPKDSPDCLGLLLVGPTGAGKTRLAWDWIHELILTKDPNLIFFDCVAFSHEITRRYRDPGGCVEEWLENVAMADLVFFDDLGKLKLTERAEVELFGLIERRTAMRLPIIATTEDSGPTLAARMTDHRGPAMIRRLRSFCHVVTLPGLPGTDYYGGAS